MTPFDLAKLFPKAGKDFLALNSSPALVRKRDTATIPLISHQKPVQGRIGSPITTDDTHTDSQRQSTPSPDITKIHESYLRTGSVHRTGAEFGTTGETIRKRLKSNGIKINRSKWTPAQDGMLIELYSIKQPNALSVAEIAYRIGKSMAAIRCRADELHLKKDFVLKKEGKSFRERTRKVEWAGLSEEEKHSVRSERAKKLWVNNPHPRGTLGKPVSQETRETISKANFGKTQPPEIVMKMLKTKEKNGTLNPKRAHGSWKSDWRIIGGRRIYARSRWEANYARYLEFLKIAGEISEWEHEPHTFWFEKIKRGVRSYLPDFRVTFPAGRIEWHEVKGCMDARSKTKLKRMAKYHPKEIMIIRDGTWFRAMRLKLRGLIPEWEDGKF